MKLVIIEDEILLVWAMTLLLEEWDHQVVGSCGTEAEAVALVARLRRNAILMDIK